MTELSDLETFAAVARSGSFAAAARRLSISPAMVGRRIQTLETRYGATLIERTTRSQRLTEIGAQFLTKANQLLETLEELGELTRPDAVGISGRIRVTAPTTLGINRLTGILAEVTEMHPDFSVELSLNDRNAELINAGFDLAIRIGELQATTMIARRIGTYHFVCCAAPGYLARRSAPDSPSALAEERCILNLNLVSRNRWRFHDVAGRPFTQEVRGHLEIDNDQALRRAALAGAGIIYAPVDLLAEDLSTGRLVQVLDSWKTVSLPIHTLHPSRAMVPRRITALVEMIARGLRRTNLFGDSPESGNAADG